MCADLSERISEHYKTLSARARGARQIIPVTRSELLPFHKENLMREIVLEKPAYFYIASTPTLYEILASLFSI